MSLPRRMIEPIVQVDVARARCRPRETKVDALVRTRAAEAGVVLHWPPLVTLGFPGLMLTALGFTLAGPVGVLLSLMALLVVWVVALRVLARRNAQRIAEHLPEVALRLARTIRAGEPVADALGAASRTSDAVSPELVRAVRQLDDGRSVVDVLEDSAAHAGSDAERLLWTSLVVGLVNGGDLAHALDMVGDGLRADIELAARRRLLVGQATMSAGVLVAMPLGFATVASVIRGSVVFQGAVGLGLLAAGLALDGVGGLWMRSLMRRLR